MEYEKYLLLAEIREGNSSKLIYHSSVIVMYIVCIYLFLPSSAVYSTSTTIYLLLILTLYAVEKLNMVKT